MSSLVLSLLFAECDGHGDRQNNRIRVNQIQNEHSRQSPQDEYGSPIQDEERDDNIGIPRNKQSVDEEADSSSRSTFLCLFSL